MTGASLNPAPVRPVTIEPPRVSGRQLGLGLGLSVLLATLLAGAAGDLRTLRRPARAVRAVTCSARPRLRAWIGKESGEDFGHGAVEHVLLAPGAVGGWRLGERSG